MSKPSGGLLYGVMLLLAASPGALTGNISRPGVQRKALLTQEDIASIKSVIEKYRTSWLSGDMEGVLSTFTEDAVVMPAQAGTPVVGLAAIQKFWWPAGGPPTKITKLDITYEQIGGDCKMGFARGRDEVGWTIEENGVTKSHANFGTYMNVMRKLPDGSWRISHHMWDDDPKKSY